MSKVQSIVQHIVFIQNSSRVKRFWVTKTIYMEISNTTTGLPKVPKWLLFIWKAVIMLTGAVKAGRCLNTAVTLCAWVCEESFISISIDAQLGQRAWQKRDGKHILHYVNSYASIGRITLIIPHKADSTLPMGPDLKLYNFLKWVLSGEKWTL